MHFQSQTDVYWKQSNSPTQLEDETTTARVGQMKIRMLEHSRMVEKEVC